MSDDNFRKSIAEGIPSVLPPVKQFDKNVNHAPKRKDILTTEEKKLALRNALRYFPEKFHYVLAREFADELSEYGRIYMYRFRPGYDIKARPISEIPHISQGAAAIMMMIRIILILMLPSIPMS